MLKVYHEIVLAENDVDGNRGGKCEEIFRRKRARLAGLRTALRGPASFQT
jgi:hypothetical protein